MQAQPEYSSITRRPMDVEDYIDILRRNIGLMFGPTFLGLVLAFVYAFTQSDVYVSDAVIRIIPPQISQRLVEQTVVVGLSQRVNALAQTVMSRSSLENLIKAHNLFPRERRKEPMEDIIERMKRQVVIGGVQQLAQSQEGSAIAAFRLSFRYDNRFLAQKVCSDLVTRFVNENLSERKKLVNGAEQFFSEENAAARQKLDEAEVKLTQFRTRNAGALPEEQMVNMSQMSSLTNQIESINQAMGRVSQEKLVLESSLSTVREQRNSLTPPAEETVATAKSDRLQALDKEIENYELRLAAARERYKDTHPDVQQLMTEIGVLKRSRDQVAKAEPSKTASPVNNGASRMLQANYEREKKGLDSEVKRLEALIRTREMEMEQYRSSLGRLQAEVRKYEGRMGTLPLSVQEYTALTRERDLARRNYEDVSNKLHATAVYKRVEDSQQGEVLEVLEPASLPPTPSEPNRWYIIAAGLGIGLGLGVLLTGAHEFKDTSLHTLKDVRAYTQLNVLGSIPLLENELTMRRRRRFRFLAWSTAVMLGVFVMSGSVYYYYLMRT